VDKGPIPEQSQATLDRWSGINPVQDAWAYWIDAWQRGILFCDVQRQRSERYQEHAAKAAPHALKFDHELLMDGRRLPRPANYALVRVVPPEGTEIDPRKRPFVIVDPRAGHGPGIGGFKADSEIGVAFKAGHPCYLIGFLPEPVPGQTIEDIAHAEAAFLQRVMELHPAAEGKPAVVGNCQAGWAVMLLAAIRPELFGPIMSAVETVNPDIPSTIDAAALCKMADRGQITGGELDGPLAFDNAINPEAARVKGIRSPVAGQAQILVVPDLEAGNMLAKNLTFLSNADAAGIVLGARVPIILTSRADNVRTRMASCAVAMLLAYSRRAKQPIRA
jgi:hypothetical protein